MTNKTVVIFWAWWLALNIGSLMLFVLIIALIGSGLPDSEWYAWPLFSTAFAAHSVFKLRQLFLHEALQKSWHISLVDLLAAVFLTATLLTVLDQFKEHTPFSTRLAVSFISGLSFLAGIFWAGFRGYEHRPSRYLYAIGIAFRTYGIVCIGAMLAASIIITINQGLTHIVDFWRSVLTGASRSGEARILFLPLAVGLYVLLPGAALCVYTQYRYRASRAPALPEKITSP